MLTISAPIEIKAKANMIKDPESFYQRIIGNYSLMETHVDQEDLLHIVSTPPEIYVSEGEGMTNILSQSERNETNINKVNILNNVLNRIVASAEVNLTYQDRVFITDALYKLGVRDDRRFMETFYNIAKETQNTNKLINLYFETGGELKQLVEMVETLEKDSSTTKVLESETESSNYLYNSVMERLKTGAIYQIVSNFNRTIDHNEIDSREYSISNQSYIAQHILLSTLREQAGVARNNLFYLDNGNYEELINSESTELTNIKSEINTAVLMDMLTTLYHTGFDRFFLDANTYYHFEDTFFKASDQIMVRLVNGFQNIYNSEHTSRDYMTENNYLSSAEIELIQKVYEGKFTEEEVDRITNTVNLNTIRNEERLRQYLIQKSQENETLREEIQEEEKKTTELEHIEQTNINEVTEEEIDRINAAVNLLNIQNEQRRQHYVREMQKVQMRLNQESHANGFEQTKKDAVLALSSPEKLAERLTERSKVVKQRQDMIFNELQRIFPEQPIDIYRILNQIRNGDTSIFEQNIVRQANVGDLLSDINEATRDTEQEKKASEKRDEATIEFLEAINRAREEEKGVSGKKTGRSPVETVHRSSETLTMEEINEQLDMMQHNISRQINRTSEQSVVTQNQVTRSTEVSSSQTQVNQLRRRDIEMMIENGVRSQMGTISDQVMNKIERQMRNEKMRRGY